MMKASYTVSCSTEFRDRVLDLAQRRGVNVGDLARSVLLLVSMDAIAGYVDPGEAALDDRETVVLKSGPSAGKPWRRKPRLQVRLPKGFDPVSIRKALAVALAIDRGEIDIKPVRPKEYEAMKDAQARLPYIVDALAFDLLPNGVQTRESALYVLGLPPGTAISEQMLRSRFRALAAVHHPDSGVGDHQRMAQLNAAMEILSK